MPRATLILVVMSLPIGPATKALAMGGNHPSGVITQQNPEWPDGLIDLIHFDGRVQGQWINQSDFFFFRGQEAGLKSFLEQYARLPDTPLAVVLHAGTVPLTSPLGEETKIRFDWELRVVRRGWGIPIDPRRPEGDPGYVVSVHVWLSDAITLKGLNVPGHVDLRSAGELERFIEHHRSRSQ
ncbi:hypothetical protein BH23PLA1_BH23PLA1_13650 [soil metagenome]